MTIKEVSKKYNISPDTLRYYERAGMIPAVTRTSGGIRDYQTKDLEWVELAICMRGAGLPVEIMAEYVRLCRRGDETILERLQLLQKQRTALEVQQRQLDATLQRLDYKISRYQAAVETGKLEWGGACP